MKIAISILDTKSPDVALLNYRATPHSSTGVSPSVALMNRNLNTKLPALPSVLLPQNPNDDKIRQSDKKSKEKAKGNYDRFHGARELSPLPEGKNVIVRENNQWNKSGVVVSGDPVNRTYLVNTGSGVIRRNRVHLQPMPESVIVQPTETPPAQVSQPDHVHASTPAGIKAPAPQVPPRVTRSSSGVMIKLPARFCDN